MSLKKWAIPIGVGAALLGTAAATGGLGDIPLIGGILAGGGEEAAALPFLARAGRAAWPFVKKALPFGLAGLGGAYYTHKWASKPPAPEAANALVQKLASGPLGSSAGQGGSKPVNPLIAKIMEAVNKTLQIHGDDMSLADIDQLLNMATSVISVASLASYREGRTRAARLAAISKLMSAQQNPMMGGGMAAIPPGMLAGAYGYGY